MKDFKIIYKRKSKYQNEIPRRSIISIQNPTGDIGKDAKAALNIFIKSIGNLKKYDIIEIQELDKEGKQIGESIKPTEENFIVPFKKK